MERNLRLLRLGIVAELRNPGLRLVGFMGLAGAAAFAWSQGALVASAALVVTAWLGRIYAVMACLWFAYVAIRDQNERLGAVVRSKPIDGGGWVTLLLVQGLCIWLILLGISFLGAMLAELPAAGLASVSSYGLAFLRAGLVVVIIGSLSFCFSRFMRSPVGGIIILFAWFCSMAGLSYIPPFLRPDYAQNMPLFLSAALLVFCAAAFGAERFRRGELRRAADFAVPLVLIPVFGLLTGLSGVRAYEATPEVRVRLNPLWESIRMQDIQTGRRMPGFWLPDGHGGTVRTAPYRGKILLTYFFAGHDMEASSTLPALDAIAAQYGKRGVQPIGICLSEDQRDAEALARTGGYRFPIAGDPTTEAVEPEPRSAVTGAYRVTSLPFLVVTDRERRVVGTYTDISYDVDRLRKLVEERLAAEPE
jgi:peroxiredoxin